MVCLTLIKMLHKREGFPNLILYPTSRFQNIKMTALLCGRFNYDRHELGGSIGHEIKA